MQSSNFTIMHIKLCHVGLHNFCPNHQRWTTSFIFLFHICVWVVAFYVTDLLVMLPCFKVPWSIRKHLSFVIKAKCDILCFKLPKMEYLRSNDKFILKSENQLSFIWSSSLLGIKKYFGMYNFNLSKILWQIT
jgi:hypothetical protein